MTIQNSKLKFFPKIIVANWKMNPASLKEADMLLKRIWLGQDKKLSNLNLIIAPPFIYLEPLLLKAKSLRLKVKFGAQDCFWENQGAYTGEISPLMLKNLGAEYVIIGHSERRNYTRESDEMISKKIKSIFENKLTPVLCVGETLEQRAKGAHKNIVQEQLRRDLACLTQNSKLKTQNFIVAYEPIWAIGTGNYCQPEEALEMIKFIKEIIGLNLSRPSGKENIKVLYGGSVDSKNIANYLKYPEIDGALVGGASLKINEFKKIIDEISETAKTEPA